LDRIDQRGPVGRVDSLYEVRNIGRMEVGNDLSSGINFACLQRVFYGVDDLKGQSDR
jgi:hypothetical protein